MIFFGLNTSVIQEIKSPAPFFFLALCLGFVQKPDIGPIPFQSIEQTIVHRCEIHMEAQYYNESLACLNIISKPGQSQGLLYKHLSNQLIN